MKRDRFKIITTLPGGTTQPSSGQVPRRARRFLVSLVGFCLLVTSAQAAAAWQLEASSWAQPRTAAQVAQLPAVQAVAMAWAQHPKRTLVIRHAGGEAGELWAAELKEWLIALGVAGSHIELRPGGRAYTLELFIQ